MVGKNQIKRIVSLRTKKYRHERGCFIAEGARLVDEILHSPLTIHELYYTANWSGSNNYKIPTAVEIKPETMEKLTSLTSPPSVLAVVKIPIYGIDEIDKIGECEQFDNQGAPPTFAKRKNLSDEKPGHPSKRADVPNRCATKPGLTLALDGVQDPGNLGTIIRLANWFGIERIMCSTTTADAFAPKVVQASMGAIAHIKLIYCNLAEHLPRLAAKLPIYGGFINGENVYTTDLQQNSILVMGNEGNGISREIETLIGKRLHIPTFAHDQQPVESLNVAMATAILCSEFCRRLT